VFDRGYDQKGISLYSDTASEYGGKHTPPVQIEKGEFYIQYDDVETRFVLG
jgi:hypothetical protein